MDEELRSELQYIKDALAEVLRRVPGGIASAANPWEALPDPQPGEGIGSYVKRVGEHIGGPEGEQAARMSGSLILPGIGQAYVDKYGGNWKLTAWRMVYGDPSYVADPQWATYRPGQ
jgi:hypothetical protein